MEVDGEPGFDPAGVDPPSDFSEGPPTLTSTPIDAPGVPGKDKVVHAIKTNNNQGNCALRIKIKSRTVRIRDASKNTKFDLF